MLAGRNSGFVQSDGPKSIPRSRPSRSQPRGPRRLPRRPRIIQPCRPRPRPLEQAGGGLQGHRPQPRHRRAGRPRGGQELSAGRDRALVALHPTHEPGDHHRARPSPGGLGPLERNPPGPAAPVRAGTPGQPPAQPRLRPSHRRVHSPQRLHRQARAPSGGRLGFAAQCEEGFSGQHAGDLLVIVDEASGVTPPIWSAIHGLAASRLVVVGNPIRYDCHFRELHDLAVKGSETIATVGISSLESPDAGRTSPPSAWPRGRS